MATAGFYQCGACIRRSRVSETTCSLLTSPGQLFNVLEISVDAFALAARMGMRIMPLPLDNRRLGFGMIHRHARKQSPLVTR